MPRYVKIPLSGSNDGGVIKISASSTPGTTIHTATSSAGIDNADEVYLYASTTTNAAVSMAIHLGNQTDEQNPILVRVPAAYNGPICVLPGVPVRNSIVVQATAVTANRIVVFGWVNRIAGQA